MAALRPRLWPNVASLCAAAAIAIACVLASAATGAATAPATTSATAGCVGPACGDGATHKPIVSDHWLFCGLGRGHGVDDDPSDISLFEDQAKMNAPVLALANGGAVSNATASVAASAAPGAQGDSDGGTVVVLALVRVNKEAHLAALDVTPSSAADAALAHRRSLGRNIATGAAGSGSGSGGGVISACAENRVVWSVPIVTTADLHSWHADRAVCFSTPLAPGNGMFYVVCGCDTGVGTAHDTSQARVTALRADPSGKAPTAAWHADGTFADVTHQTGSRMVYYRNPAAATTHVTAAAAPAEPAEVILVPSDNGLAALDGASGHQVWATAAVRDASTPLLVSPPAAATNAATTATATAAMAQTNAGVGNTSKAHGAVIVVSTQPNEASQFAVIGLDVVTGGKLWSTSVNTTGDSIGAFPVIIPPVNGLSRGTLAVYSTGLDNSVWGVDLDPPPPHATNHHITFKYKASSQVRGVYASPAAKDKLFVKLTGISGFRTTAQQLVSVAWHTPQGAPSAAFNVSTLYLPCGERCHGGLVATEGGLVYGVGAYGPEDADSAGPSGASNYGWPGYVYAVQYQADTAGFTYEPWGAPVMMGLPKVDDGGVAILDAAPTAAMGDVGGDGTPSSSAARLIVMGDSPSKTGVFVSAIATSAAAADFSAFAWRCAETAKPAMEPDRGGTGSSSSSSLPSRLLSSPAIATSAASGDGAGFGELAIPATAAKDAELPATAHVCTECPPTGYRDVVCCFSWIESCHKNLPFEHVSDRDVCDAVQTAPTPNCGPPPHGSGSGSGVPDDHGHHPPPGDGPPVNYTTIAAGVAGGCVVIGLCVAFLLHKRKSTQDKAMISLNSMDGDNDDEDAASYIRL